MRIPAIRGIIDRRILVNFTADPSIVRSIIPEPFAPKLYKDNAIIGICLIRLRQVRPKGMPAFIGISSENAAHRFAVEWIEDGKRREGVYIPRRDSSSVFNNLAGGRFFPGIHHRTKFDVRESGGNYHISFQSNDGISFLLDAHKTPVFPSQSIFGSLENASAFFEAGSLGYSPGRGRYDGLELKTFDWKVQALEVKKVNSGFFENEKLFPKGSVTFDNALLMTGLEHEWHAAKSPEVCCGTGSIAEKKRNS